MTFLIKLLLLSHCVPLDSLCTIDVKSLCTPTGTQWLSSHFFIYVPSSILLALKM